MTETNSVFSGATSLEDYLNPAKHPDTPLVELPADLNPYREKGVRIYAKMMSATPLQNVKSVPAFNMLATAKADGKLEGKTSIIENSSGNTVFSLSVIGKILANLKTSAYVSNEISAGKLKLLRFFGVTPIVNEEPICPNPADETSGIYKAKEKSEKDPGWINPGQYDNLSNPEAHHRVTGEQIWRQTEGRIGMLCAGLGTTGTMVGTSGFLKKNNPKIRTLGVIRSPNNQVPGPRTRNLLEQIAFDWEGATDETIEIGTVSAYATSLELCRHGLLVGPSSGFALAGLLQHLKHAESKQQLEKLKNGKEELICVFVCCDTPYPYLDEYFSVLEECHFPAIENPELLLEKTRPAETNQDVIQELTPHEAWNTVYSINASDAWERLTNGETVAPNDGWTIIDLRPPEQFAHFRLPGSINLPFQGFSADKIDDNAKKGKLLLVCSWGIKSRRVWALLQNQDMEAYSLKSGLTEWSKENLPRQRPQECHLNHPGSH
jgi:cysteine synthase/rhodanese-related sulfurtransferase